MDKTTDKEYEYCLRCGRRLKKDKARKLGYGPACFKKVNKQHRYKLFTLDSK